MTNAEKYKTAAERAKAHEAFCDKQECIDCPCNITKDEETEWRLCAFKWLEIDAEKKIESCPFCGSECEREEDVYGANYVNCTNYDCLYSSGIAKTIEDAIAAHNRLARAIKAAGEGAAK